MKTTNKLTHGLLAGFILTATLFTSTTLQAEPVKLKLDKSHSSVDFSVKHLSISKVRGSFRDFSTDVTWDSENPSNSSISGIIDVASIDTGNEKRDKHLKSGDFFKAKKFPNISFESLSIEKESDDMYTVNGKLTVKDITKDVSFPLEIIGTATGPYGKTRIAMEASLKINRFDYGVKWGNKLKDGNLIVDETVSITINPQFIVKK